MVEWLGTSLLLVRHREEVRQLISGGLHRVLGRKTSIAITGMMGAGKTVLLDHLTGKPFRKSGKEIVYEYTPPRKSQRAESGVLKSAGRRRILLTTVPGQESYDVRGVALDRLFRGSRAVEGVIHVVANGFARVQGEATRHASLSREDMRTIEGYRRRQLESELSDLDETCEAIRAAQRKSRAPRWLIVAVQQSDLFQDRMDEVRERYTSGSDSEFAARIRRLRTQVGTDFFRWEETLPASTFLDPFDWGGERCACQIGPEERDAYLAQFVDVLRSYCQ